jgi:hypothetical protein
MAKELVIALQQQISESHQRCVDLSKQLEEILLEQLAATRKTGVLLQTAQADLTSAEFKELRDVVGIDSIAIKNYLSFAARHREPVTRLGEALGCMKNVLQTTGLLEFAPPGTRRSASADQFWAYATQTVRNIVAAWRQFTADERALTQDEKDQFLGILRPLLDIARSLL